LPTRLAEPPPRALRANEAASTAAPLRLPDTTPPRRRRAAAMATPNSPQCVDNLPANAVEKYPQVVDSAVDKKLDFRGTNSLKSKPRKLIFVFGCFATHLGRTATAVETKQWGPYRAIGRSRSKGARQRLLVSTIGLLVSPRRATCRASGNDFTCRPGKPRKGDFASKPPRPSSPARCLGEDTLGAQQIGRPSRESRGASVLETVRVRSRGGFSGNHRCYCDERSSQFRG
jgi:hypothetical protein